MKNKFVIVTHAVLSESSDIAGPAHTLASYLNKKGAEYIFIRHSLFESDQTLVSYRKNNKNREYKLNSFIKFGEIINRLLEGIRTIKVTLFFSKNSKPIYIGIDPLNGFWGLVLKKLGKIKTLITFTVDYSPQRFSNKILNSIYHFIDRVTLNEADEAWVVSKRIYDVRIKQGKNPKSLFFVPNAPSFNQVKYLIKKTADPLNVITIGTISKALDFELIIRAIGTLVKKYPSIKLTIIGAGKGVEDLTSQISKDGLEDNIFLTGRKSHKEVFQIISKHGIGIALYTDDASWSYYSDSMKARDYLALGLPVIISGNIGTTEEIKKKSGGCSN